MKFEFKEGQWFDVRKLTAWQKQWCLENIVFTKYARKMIENEGVYRYRYKGESFISISPDYIHPKDELTFNDFYWDEKEEVSTQESIFNKPRWVTCCNDSLGQVTLGKDYKVVNVNNDNYTIIMDKGIEGNLHKNRFHKVTPQDLLPDESIEGVEESFDNLELKTEKSYFSEDTCFVLFKDVMSNWQHNCLKYKLKTFYPHLWEDYDESLDSADVYIFDSNGLIWGGSGCDRNYWNIEEIHFNDLFQEVTTHQD